MGGKWVVRGGRLFEAERLLTFSAFRMGAYSNKCGTCFAVIFLMKLNERNEAYLYTVQSYFIHFPSSGFH